MDPSRLWQKPPFANYDLVVYFGGGLFVVPFLIRYVLQPIGVDSNALITEFYNGLNDNTSVAAQVVAGLSMIFFLYITGHVTAYLSSQFIEKSVQAILGKASTSIIVSSRSDRNRNDGIRAIIYSRITKIKSEWWHAPHLARFVFHLPLAIFYIMIFFVGVFGYYKTRIPRQILSAASKRFHALGFVGLRVSLNQPWFKTLEYYVINNNPPAAIRMYNYLVIHGLFRTLSFVFLCCIWLQITLLFMTYNFGENLSLGISAIAFGKLSSSLWFELFVTVFLYFFSLFSFAKFQRRYAEEAIFAFVFDNPSREFRITA